MKRRLLSNAYAWMAVAAVAFALMNLFARLSQPYASWAVVAFGRAAIGAVLMAALGRRRRVSLAVRNQKKAWARSIAGAISVLAGFYVIGSPEVDIGDVAAIGATAPVIVAILAPIFLGERGQRRVWLCASISFAGVVAIAHPMLATSGHLVVVMVVAAFSTAFAMISLRSMASNESPEAVALHFFLVTAGVLFVAAIPGFELPRGMGIVWIVATGVVGGLGQIAQTRAFGLGEAAPVGVISYLNPTLTQAFGVLILGEALGVHQIGGTLAVAGAGVILALDRRPPSSGREGSEADAPVTDRRAA
jgi:drug/metabolite transporter (DMT)-like permease